MQNSADISIPAIDDMSKSLNDNMAIAYDYQAWSDEWESRLHCQSV